MRRLKENNFRKKKLGRKCILGEENEEKLVKYIQLLEKSGFPITTHDIRNLAYRFAVQNGIKHFFNTEKKEAGYDWMKLFLKRHPELSIRQAQGVSLTRMNGMCKNEVEDYFKILEEVLVHNDILNFPRKIYNIDETGLQLNNNPSKVIATRGSKSVCSATSAERGETVTVISCINAEGNFLPPCCIFKGKNKKKEFEDGLPPGGKVFMNKKSSYINVDIFKQWLKDVFVPRKDSGKVLLLLDGHTSHCSDPELLDFTVENDIILLCLPSHTTHWLQPLDRSFFKPLKTYWEQACSQWLRNNPRRKISRLQFPLLLNSAWSKSATIQNCVSGFQACGIYPLNPSIIPDYAFIGNNQPETIIENENHDTNLVINNSKVTFQDIAPIPLISRKGVPTRRKQHAQILTSPEVIEEKRKKKEKKIKLPEQVDSPNNEIEKSKKNKKSKKESNLNSDDSKNKDNFCKVCNGYFYDKNGIKCDWIRCTKCRGWVHEVCTPSQRFCQACLKK